MSDPVPSSSLPAGDEPTTSAIERALASHRPRAVDAVLRAASQHEARRREG